MTAIDGAVAQQRDAITAEQLKGIDASQTELDQLGEFDLAARRIAQSTQAAKGRAAQLGATPQAQAAQASFLDADFTPQARQQQIEQLDRFNAAQRQAITSEGVSAPDAAQIEELVNAVAPERQAITADQLSPVIASQTDLSQLGNYQLAVRRTAQSAEAATGAAAQLGVAPESIAAQAAYVAAGQISIEDAANIDDIPEFQVAAQRTAPVGEAAQAIASQLGEAPAVDLEGREAILGEAPKGSAARLAVSQQHKLHKCKLLLVKLVKWLLLIWHELLWDFLKK